MPLSSVVKWLATVGIVVASLSLPAYAQDAIVSGKVTDTTGGVLPGVVVTAVNEASGNTYQSVTDERGDYRLPIRIGTYRIAAELTGFAGGSRTVEMQVGQTIVVDLQLRPSDLQESITVTGEAPLISTVSSTVSANIDRRQMESIPLLGRNWMDLALLAPGVRSIESSGVPEERQGYSQINVDGQQVTALLAATETEQPKYSRDAIAEFEIVSNRFDASQGRSAGFAVNAITKSGTNAMAGTLSGYFRDDRLNAADAVQKRVIPYKNQQIGGTFGGPIRRDRIHYFGNYEYEREPNTLIYAGPYPRFNMDIPVTRTERKGIVRTDVQFTTQTRLSVRGQGYSQYYYTGGGATTHPGGAAENQRYGKQAWASLTKVISNSSVLSVEGGYASFTRGNRPWNLNWQGGCNPNAPKLTEGRCGGSPTVAFTGYSIGSTTGQLLSQNASQAKAQLTTSYNWKGRHDVKIGGDVIMSPMEWIWCTGCMGAITLANNTRPPANVEDLFPVWNDVSTWNFGALSPQTLRVSQTVSSTGFVWYPRTDMAGAWYQDDWQISPRLTLNLGMRWDVQVGAYNEKLEVEPWLPGDLPYDLNNFGPRIGGVFSRNERTVLRGGYGLYYTQATTDEAQQTLAMKFITGTETQNDGRPNFAGNWFNGPTLTFDQALARACDQNRGAAGCLRRNDPAGEINLKWQPTAYSHQASIGFQRQLGATIGVDADVVYTGGRGEERVYNMNRTFSPVTGDQNNFNTIALRAFPNWGTIRGAFREGWSDYYGLQMAFKKRMANRWQASVSYSFSNMREGTPAPDQFSFAGGVESADTLTRTPVNFLRWDVGRQYNPTSAAHHRLVNNAIWDIGRGMQLSGVYLFTDGGFLTTSCGCQIGTGLSNRLRLDGSVIDINNFNRAEIHRLDMRFSKRIALGGGRTIDGIVEMFNLTNHGNFGSYTVDESNALFGRPVFNSNIAYQPRVMQLGFRVAF